MSCSKNNTSCAVFIVIFLFSCVQSANRSLDHSADSTTLSIKVNIQLNVDVVCNKPPFYIFAVWTVISELNGQKSPLSNLKVRWHLSNLFNNYSVIGMCLIHFAFATDQEWETYHKIINISFWMKWCIKQEMSNMSLLSSRFSCGRLIITWENHLKPALYCPKVLIWTRNHFWK